MGQFHVSDDDTAESADETDWAAGALAGYRVVARDDFALRVEAGWMRHFPEAGEESDCFFLRFGLGGILNSRTPATAAR